MPSLDQAILGMHQNMLHMYNPYVKVFQQVRHIIAQHPTAHLALRIIADVSGRDPRRYNCSTSNEVTVIMPGNYTALFLMKFTHTNTHTRGT